MNITAINCGDGSMSTFYEKQRAAIRASWKADDEPSRLTALRKEIGQLEAKIANDEQSEQLDRLTAEVATLTTKIAAQPTEQENDVSNEPQVFSKAKIEDRMQKFQRGKVSEGTARMKAVARIAAEHGLYGALFLGTPEREEPQTVGKAQRGFNKRVAEIRRADGCSHTQAMQRARQEYPDEFEALQAS